MKLLIFIWLTSILLTPLTAFCHDSENAQDKLVQQITNAQHALFQGDLNPAKRLVNNKNLPLNYELSKLTILFYLEQELLDKAERAVTELEQQFDNQAKTFAFSAEAWRSIGHLASIFSKQGYYRKAVAAKIKVGKLAPNDPKYLTLQASALGQSESYGGRPDAQMAATKQVMRLDKKWGYIAQINQAQSNDNFAQGKELAEQAAKEFAQDFDVLERIAQLYWTLGEDRHAQDYFFRACNSQSDSTWHAQEKWFNACYRVAMFAKEQNLQLHKALLALTNLLNAYQLPTWSNYELANLYLSLAKDNNITTAPAKALLQRITHESIDGRLVKKAQQALKTLTS